MSSQLSSALALAQRGFRVFPCRPGSKLPAFPKNENGPSLWQSFATTDPLVLAEKWAEDPSYNPAIFTRGYVVIDVDTHKGIPLETFTSLGPMPKTFTVRTARGGYHFYFKTDEAIGNSRGALPAGIDVRGHGGLALGPGAKFKSGQYEIVDDCDPAPLPGWLAGMLRPIAKSPSAPGAMLGEVDSAAAIERAEAYIARQAPAIEGENGDDRTYKICAYLRRDLNLSAETCLELLEPWNATCIPPWDDEQLAQKLENAGRYGQNLAGLDNPVVGLGPIEAPPQSPSKFLASITDYTNRREDDAAAPRLPWVAANRLMRRNLTAVFAPGATGKSLLMLEWAVALALGPEAGGSSAFCGLEVRERCKVLVINAEDETAVMKLRLGAVCDEFKIPREQVWGRIKLQSGKDQASFRFRAALKDPKTGAIKPTPEVSELIEYCKSERVDVIIVDPLVRTHTANENDNGEMQQVADIFEHIAVGANAAVVLPHHTKKPGRGGYAELAGSADAGRGATAIKDTSRVALTLFPMSEAEGEKLSIPAHTRHRYVRLDDAKMNFGLAGPAAEWFVKKTVTLANGEQTGVLEPVLLGRRHEIVPSPLELEGVYKYLCEITASGEWQKLSADHQAPNFIARRSGILPDLDAVVAQTVILAALAKLKDQGRAELTEFGRANKARKIPERWRAIISDTCALPCAVQSAQSCALT